MDIGAAEQCAVCACFTMKLWLAVDWSYGLGVPALDDMPILWQSHFGVNRASYAVGAPIGTPSFRCWSFAEFADLFAWFILPFQDESFWAPLAANKKHGTI